MRPPRDWRDQAACRGIDPELFFPVVEDGPLCAVQIARAKSVCAGCPVRTECLGWALETLSHGIAGGLTEPERSAARVGHRKPGGRRASGRPVCGTRPEVAAAGRAAIRDGQLPHEVARRFEVSERTALRWAAQVRRDAHALSGQQPVAGVES